MRRRATERYLEILRFGKPVTAPRGPVRPGAEHGVTGRSAGFPAWLDPWCIPSLVGLGDDGSLDWDAYPWRTEGGCLVRIPVAGPEESRESILYGRARLRPESGDSGGGRRYCEAVYAAAPLEGVGSGELAMVLAALRPEPVVGGTARLATLELGSGPVGGREGYGPGLGEWIEVLASGHGLSVQDWELSLESFVARVEAVLAAFPPVVARVMPVAAGIVAMDGSHALALGMKAMAGVRVVGGALRGLEGLDLGPGRRYREWVEPVIAGAAGIREVADRVEEAWEALARGRVPAGDWRTRMAEVVGAVGTAPGSPEEPGAEPRGADGAGGPEGGEPGGG